MSWVNPAARIRASFTRGFCVLLLGLGLLGSAQAAIDAYEFDSEVERQRFRTLTVELRCPKCQNQNIADSDAPIANDLRREIFQMIDAGQNDEYIVDFLVARYGEFVLYKPPVNARTALLWYGPAGLLALGFALLGLIVLRRRRQKSTQHDLSADEQQRLAALLAQTHQESPAAQAPLGKLDKRDNNVS